MNKASGAIALLVGQSVLFGFLVGVLLFTEKNTLVLLFVVLGNAISVASSMARLHLILGEKGEKHE